MTRNRHAQSSYSEAVPGQSSQHWWADLPRLLRRSLTLLGIGGIFTLFIISCQPVTTAQQQQPTPTPQTQPTPTETPEGGLSASPAELPPLPYSYDALEPYIDAETMELHHDRHHATYVENLNGALADYPDLQNQTVEAMLRDLDAVPEDIREDVRNNGGGHVKHTLFWQIMSPEGGGEPTGALAEAINQTFGSFAEFQQAFEQEGADRFGSGWVWLVLNDANELEITSTPNQDTPVMAGNYPIMGNDVWEHAYYLSYRNERGEYLSNWWNVANWEEINRRYEQGQVN
jgi:superoxide dismutase, Fe-Mn family